MAGENTLSSLNALTKKVYGARFEELVPDFGILQKMVGWKNAEKLGDTFIQAVSLSHEQGFTYGGGAATLEDAVTAATAQATVSGSPLTLRSIFAYDIMAAASAKGEKAFIAATEYRLMKQKASAAYRLELQLLHGGDGLAVGDDSQTAVISDTVDVTIPITAASWSSGIWSGAENANCSFFKAADASAIAGVTTNKASVKSVDVSSKAVKFTFASGSDATAAKAAVDAHAHNIFFYNAKGNEMTGLSSIASNTGTLFGINGANYSMWQGNTYAAGSVDLSLAVILKAVEKPVSKGLQEDVACLVNPLSFAKMGVDEAALRRYGAEKKASRGVESIDYYGSNGKISIVVHPMCKLGEAIIFPKNELKRIGSSDVTFKTPGRGDDLFLQSPTTTSIETRVWSDQALFTSSPSKFCKITGLTTT